MTHRAIYISTTGIAGAPSPVVFNDLSGRWFDHPTTDYELSQDFSFQEISESRHLQEAVNNGWVTLKDENGNIITDVGSIGGGGSNQGSGYAGLGFALSCALNSSDLDCSCYFRPDDVYMNKAPWVMPFNVDIVAMSMICRDKSGNWRVQVYKNDKIWSRPNSTYAIVDETSGDKKYYKTFDTPIQLNAGDEIAAYLRNADDVEYPRVILFFRKR